MKLLIALVILLFSATYVNAGATIYEKGDLKLGINDMTVMTAWDFNSQDIKFGAFTTIAEWKMLNGDIGIIKGDEENEGISPMAGISIDTQEAIEAMGGEWKLPQSIKVGAFGARDFKNDDWMAGLYAGIEFSF